MSLISEADQEKLRAAFGEMTSPVRLMFFTQTLDCETCLQTRQILDELPPLSDKVSIEEVDQTQGLKLENGAQLMSIPGVDLAKLTPAKRAEALQKLNAQPCTCGCDLTVAKCRVDDPNCGVSLPIARQIVAQIAGPDQP